MTGETMLSIILVTHNDEKTLKRTLDSIIKQDNKGIEILCVDRESTDGTIEIIRDYSGRYPLVSLVSVVQKTEGEALNIGIENAQGEYIHFIQPGDIVVEHAYECVLAKAVKHDLDVLKFCAISFDEEIENTYSDREYMMSDIGAGNIGKLLSIYKDDVVLAVSRQNWTGIYKKSFWNGHGFSFAPDYASTDYSIFYEILKCNPKLMVYTDRVLLHDMSLEKNYDYNPKALGRKCDSLAEIRECLENSEVDFSFTEKVISKESFDVLDIIVNLKGDNKERDEAINKAAGLYERIPYGVLLPLRAAIKNIKVVYEDGGVIAKDKVIKEYRKRTPGYKLINGRECKKVSFFYKKHKRPKVSVVMPIYNQQEYLNIALDAVCMQTLTNMEIVCVNDGSSDSSISILKQYASLDKRIVIIDKANSGYGNSMNVGMDAATGEYIGIFEPDDIIPADMYKDLYDVAAENDLDFIKSDFYRFRVDDEGNIITLTTRLLKGDDYTDRVIRGDEIIKTSESRMNTWNGIYKKSFLNLWNIRHNETPGASYQDNGFWFQTFIHASRIWYSSNAYYMYRVDNVNASIKDPRKFYEMTREYGFIYDKLKEDPELLKTFEGVYFDKKVGHFVESYRRLSEDLKLDYLKHVKGELEGPLKEGRIDADLLGQRRYKQLTDVIRNPEEYYERLWMTIVLPLRGDGFNIDRCLKSILQRKDFRREILLIDNRQSEELTLMATRYRDEDSRIRIVECSGADLPGMRNAGLDAAKGIYIIFVDTDRDYYPHAFCTAYEAAYTDDSDVVTFWPVNEDGREEFNESAKYLIPGDDVFSGADVSEDAFSLFSELITDYLFRVEYLRNTGIRFRGNRASEDRELTFCSVLKAERISFLKRRMYMKGSKEISEDDNVSMQYEYDVLSSIKGRLKESGMFDALERSFVNYALKRIVRALKYSADENYSELFDRVRSEWLGELGIIGRSDWYFYKYGVYSELQEILSLSPKAYRGMNLKHMEEDISRSDGELRMLRRRNENLTSSNERFKARNNKLIGEITDIKESESYKIGLKITSIPRKLLGKA